MRHQQTLVGVGAMPSTYGTAFMVGFIEWACEEALRPYLDDDEKTIGTRVELTQMATTPVGVDVTANVEMVAANGHTLCFKVSCNDEFEVIGQGYHGRALISPRRERPREFDLSPA
jgi:fluoroacetyl-CoA thioesterase